MENGRDVRNVLIIGAGTVGRKLAAHMTRDLACKRVVVGFLDEVGPIGDDIHGRVEDLARIARAEFVDEIILTAPQHPEVARRVIRGGAAQPDRCQSGSRIFLDSSRTIRWCFEKFGNIPVLTLREERLPTFCLLLKRTVDAVSAAVALALAAPLLAIIALAIKWESRGPSFIRRSV